MKRIDLGQTITILANLGVIAGIVFLGLELQQNNSLLASQARMNIYEARTLIDGDFIRNVGGVGDLINKAISGAELSGYEIARINVRNRLILDTWQLIYREDPRSLAEMSEWVFRVMEITPYLSEYWTQNKRRLDSEFVDFVDRTTAELFERQ